MKQRQHLTECSATNPIEAYVALCVPCDITKRGTYTRKSRMGFSDRGERRRDGDPDYFESVNGNNRGL